ncbi:MAG: ferrous iron transport protein A [Candidatus Polarisedimenticolaceae bacterium]|nr:ferrous iron transport protein A [Candidatus Polarisedimenticolaceae bacterium]
MQETRSDNEAGYSAAELKLGQHGVISSIQGGDSLRRRLNALGMVKGAELVVAHAAPMGDPRSYIILGYQVSLRKEEARNILLQVAN